MFDALADAEDDDHGEERRDADEVRRRGIGRRIGQPLDDEIEHRGRRGPRPRRPADLQEVERDVDPRPQRGRGTRAHEAREHRLARGERVAHHFGVEDGLEDDRDQDDPEQREPVLHERGGAEEEFAAADRDAQRDDAGPDGTQPAEPLGAGGTGSSASCQSRLVTSTLIHVTA